MLFRRGPKPLQTVIFEVTQACNHDCRHCYNVWKCPRGYPDGQLDTAGTKRLLERIFDETRTGHLTLSGGEPLLREDIFDLMAHAAERHVNINLLTNGSLVDEATAKRCADAGVTLFEIPLLSAEPETHDYLTGASSFDEVVEAIPNARLSGAHVVAVFVVTKLNADHIRRTIEMAFALGAQAMMVNRFNVGGRGIENLAELMPSAEHVRDALAVADDCARRFGLPVSCSVPVPPCVVDTSEFEKVGFGFCAAGTERAYYTFDALGNVRMCNHTPTIIGNILEQPFGEIVASASARDFMAAVPEECAGCEHLRECQGGCKAAAEQCYADLTACDPFLSHCTDPSVARLARQAVSADD
ncbi:MAG: radical SAM protein [Armatimonadota bacterium]|jgi:radical SAM protein with 4Fe4S-binding SPASM domain